MSEWSEMHEGRRNGFIAARVFLALPHYVPKILPSLCGSERRPITTESCPAIALQREAHVTTRRIQTPTSARMFGPFGATRPEYVVFNR